MCVEHVSVVSVASFVANADVVVFCLLSLYIHIPLFFFYHNLQDGRDGGRDSSRREMLTRESRDRDLQEEYPTARGLVGR